MISIPQALRGSSIGSSSRRAAGNDLAMLKCINVLSTTTITIPFEQTRVKGLPNEVETEEYVDEQVFAPSYNYDHVYR
jgi:hypothetical protein